jgi:hypothetical protein
VHEYEDEDEDETADYRGNSVVPHVDLETI